MLGPGVATNVVTLATVPGNALNGATLLMVNGGQAPAKARVQGQTKSRVGGFRSGTQLVWWTYCPLTLMRERGHNRYALTTVEVDIVMQTCSSKVSQRGALSTVGRDITILVGRPLPLQKSQFKKPDKVPQNYDQRVFSLDGKMELDITFEGLTMKTPVYIKADAPEQLLLGEGVCRQLGINPKVVDQKSRCKRPRRRKRRCKAPREGETVRLPTPEDEVSQTTTHTPTSTREVFQPDPLKTQKDVAVVSHTVDGATQTEMGLTDSEEEDYARVPMVRVHTVH